jgi:hypothetical protein
MFPPNEWFQPLGKPRESTAVARPGIVDFEDAWSISKMFNPSSIADRNLLPGKAEKLTRTDV